jgi:DNA polymerase IV
VKSSQFFLADAGTFKMSKMTTNRIILHCDMNGFFASVELLDYPELCNVPMAVCGDPKNRHGIILAKNDLAKAYGITTAETLWQAKKKCPQLQCIPPHMEKYQQYSKKINEIYLQFTDLVEPFSIDESWLDVTASQRLFGTGTQIADRIREIVKSQLGLTLSVGVSFNKIFAKMGSEYKKPDATTIITPENYQMILWPLPIEEMFFVGKVSAEKLRKSGIDSIGALARAPRPLVKRLLGKQGELLHDYANGLDDAPVLPQKGQDLNKSIGNSMTFRRDLMGLEDMSTAIIALADKVAERLRKAAVLAGGMRLEIKDPNFHSISRQRMFPVPISNANDLTDMALSILRDEWLMTKPIRLLQLTAIHLTEFSGEVQLSLLEDRRDNLEKREKVGATMDEIREKYGAQSIGFGRVMHNDIGVSGITTEIDAETANKKE